MTFFVQKSLAHGPIRFGVSPRQALDRIDHDRGLSTGSAGEFLRKGSHGYFIADTTPIAAPVLPTTPSISKTPFWTSLRGEGVRGLGFMALMAVGVLLLLLGLAVLFRKGPAGWVEVFLGLILISVPIGITARERRQILQREEMERVAREERERKNRDLLASYNGALQRLRENPDAGNLAAVERERQALDLPYEIWSTTARRSVLHIGFEALARSGADGAAQASELLGRAAAAAGLSESHTRQARLDLYRVYLWHLLADDRLGPIQASQLDRMRAGLGISDPDLGEETRATEEFRRLQGVDRDHLPRAECSVPLKFHEYCILSTQASLLDDKEAERGKGALVVTNKRLILDLKKPVEIELMQVDEVDVDADRSLVTLRAAKPAKPWILKTEQPIYTAALIDLAASIDERPRAFA